MTERISIASHGRRWRIPFIPVVDFLSLIIMFFAIVAAGSILVISQMRYFFDEQGNFWEARAKALCVAADQVPKRPRLGESASPIDILGYSSELSAYRAEIWRLHTTCTEERVAIIGENLLRFRFDKWDEFDMEPSELEAAKRQIVSLVRQNSDNLNIFIRGHSDDIGTLEYNYVLSYRRALFVANVIREHLARRGLREGEGYKLNLAGYGKTRLLQREPGEQVDQWQSRCRRIELGFKRLSDNALETGTL